MIISHKYQYVFIQLGQTASSSIAKELCKFYDGEEILWKHATYNDFINVANDKEKKYFIFSGIRNPFDVVVSIYFRHRLDPKKRFSKMKDESVTNTNLKMYNFIKNKADFSLFFKKFYVYNIYNDWKTKDFDRLNYVYRYEDLQNEFSKILEILNIKQIRPLPNKSIKTGRDCNFEKYYTSDIQGISQVIFASYMKRFKYKFPRYWKKPNLFQNIVLRLLLYFKFFFQNAWHLIIDIPRVYKKLYRLN